jgi:hypothetical protein
MKDRIVAAARPRVVYWNSIPSPYMVGGFIGVARRGATSTSEMGGRQGRLLGALREPWPPAPRETDNENHNR